MTGGHEHGSHTLNDGARGFLESAHLVAASSVRHINLLADGFHLEVVGKGMIRANNTLI